jgi:inhibitor of KinA sporulation pathway (predicted exonuclease)
VITCKAGFGVKGVYDRYVRIYTDTILVNLKYYNSVIKEATMGREYRRIGDARNMERILMRIPLRKRRRH